MTVVARALSFVHGVTRVFLAYAATVSLKQGAWPFASAFFGAAVLSGVAGCLGYAPETGTTHTDPHPCARRTEPSHAVRSSSQRPGSEHTGPRRTTKRVPH